MSQEPLEGIISRAYLGLLNYSMHWKWFTFLILMFRFRGGGSGCLSGLSRAGRAEAEFSISGRRLWDAPFLIQNYYQNNDFGPPAVQVPADGFCGLSLLSRTEAEFCIAAGGSGMIRSCYETIIKVMILCLRPSRCIRPAFRPQPTETGAAGRVRRRLNFRFRGGDSGMPRP